MNINQENYYPLQLPEILALRKNNFLSVSAFVYFILKYENQLISPDTEIDINVSEFTKTWNITRSTFYQAANKLNKTGLIKIKINQSSSAESEIRDRLNLKLKGFIEVNCPAGRIDLLTETQIIEVKKISDWKSALGQILVYSGYYPEHQKRIHLFGSETDAEKLLDIELSCSAFDVVVTFEAVGGND